MSLENGDGAGTKYSSSGRHGAVSVWLLDPSEQHAGESLMPNISAWPNDASVCSLSSVLETGLIPEKYYLSGKACDGILRRAERRGKALPAALRDALVAVANGPQKSAPPLNTSWADRSAGSQAQEWDSEKGGRFVPEVGFSLNAKGGGGRIDGESETFVATFQNTGHGWWNDRDTAAILRTPKGAGSLEANVVAEVAGCISPGAHPGGFNGQDAHNDMLVAHSLRADGFDASEDGMGRGTPLVPVAVPLQEVGKRTGVSTDDPRAGIGIGGEGDPMYTLQAGAQHGVAIAFHGTQDPCANYGDTTPTIGCNQGQEACIAYNLRGREGGAMPEPTDVASVRAASGGSSRSYVCNQSYSMVNSSEFQGIIEYAEKTQADTVALLRRVREEIGAEAFTEWGSGVLDSLQSQEVLRCEVHGQELRQSPGELNRLVNDTLPRAETLPAWTLREMREAGRERRSPPGWKPPKQRARELDAYLSKLPQQGASAAEALLDMRGSAEGPGILQQASAATEEARRSAGLQDPAEEEVSVVRSLQQCAGPMWAALYGSQEARITTRQGGQGLAGVRRLTPL